MASFPQTPLKMNPAYRQITVEEFLELPFEGRAELDDGVLHMMAGGSNDHATLTGNIFSALRERLRGSGCRVFGPDFAVRTSPATVRLPDSSIYCRLQDRAEARRAKLLGDPKLVVEVLSLSTRRLDETVKLQEYRARCRNPSGRSRVRASPVGRTDRAGGLVRQMAGARRGRAIPGFPFGLPHAEIFARD